MCSGRSDRGHAVRSSTHGSVTGVAAGANVKAIQRMLGNASASMTLDICAGLLGDNLNDVAARLDWLIDGNECERTER